MTVAVAVAMATAVAVAEATGHRAQAPGRPKQAQTWQGPRQGDQARGPGPGRCSGAPLSVATVM
eukprot:7530845-Heterocapsa_arctica.AAC.1